MENKYKSANTVERRSGTVEYRMSSEGEDQLPEIRGYAAVFDSESEDLGGFTEVIARTAFEGRLNDNVVALFNHDPNLVLGRTTAGTLSLFVDERGLGYTITPPDTQAGRDFLVSLKRGDISQSSFGFTIEGEQWEENRSTGKVTRTVTKIGRLFDVSPVTFPAYPETEASTRSFNQWKAENEKERSSEVETELAIFDRRVKEASLGL